MLTITNCHAGFAHIDDRQPPRRIPTYQLPPAIATGCSTYQTPPWHADAIGAGVRSTAIGEIFKGTDGACAVPVTQNFPCPAVAKATPSLIQWTFTSQTGSLFLSLYAPRYCLTASAGFGRQFAKLRALSRLRRRYDSRKKRNPRPPAFPTSSPAPDRPRCSAGRRPPACPRRESGASGAFAARTAG